MRPILTCLLEFLESSTESTTLSYLNEKMKEMSNGNKLTWGCLEKNLVKKKNSVKNEYHLGSVENVLFNGCETETGYLSSWCATLTVTWE